MVTEEQFNQMLDRVNRSIGSLKRRMEKEIPNEADRPLQSSKSQPPIRHESLAEGQGKKKGARRFIVRITSFRSRLLDLDNLCAKSLLDSLRYAGLIPGDSPQDITLVVSQEKCAKKDERTEIEII